MLDARFSHLHFCESLPTPQRGLSAIADLLVFYRREMTTSLERVITTTGQASDTIIYVSIRQVALQHNFVLKVCNFVTLVQITEKKYSNVNGDHAAHCVKSFNLIE